jgi:hypothetical protein
MNSIDEKAFKDFCNALKIKKISDFEADLGIT